MAWADEMVTILRYMVNDADATTYSDDRLTYTLVVAAQLIKTEVTFSTSYSVNVNNQTISPDPTTASPRDESYINLVCLKAAAMTDHGSAIQAARRAISVRDGSSAIDLRGQLEGWLKLLEKGYKALYEQAKLEYKMGQTPIAGAMVLTPFRTAISIIGARSRSS